MHRKKTLEQRREDANELLDFAVEKGIEVDAADISALRGPDLTQPPTPIPDADPGETGFDKAYARLAKRMRPVTADTLRATDLSGSNERRFGSGRWLWSLLIWEPAAVAWSRTLWLVTIACLVAIGVAVWNLSLLTAFAPIDVAPDEEVFAGENNNPGFWEFVLPFLFGALGACAYLLRTCHWYIHRRTFDPGRKPEYVSRMLLGLVAGGAGGILFGRYIMAGAEGAAELSAAAVGFLCGYNNDFLFTTIERLAVALFPSQSPAKPAPTEATAEPTPDGGDESKAKAKGGAL